MIDLVREHLPDIKQICRQFQVKRLELFGSALAQEQYESQRSDLDFLVEFLPLKTGEHADAYFGLLAALEDMFGCRIDLIVEEAIKNRYFLESVNRGREVLYAA